ncbi:hypothetical protein Ahy_B02g061540 isoform B [Arachis hypogaea]|uniref:Uncharacterized protein n=1 Tax=Arachis hypogaea TaxID=3818 RepID=A0A445AL71_ARAHY|nr:hypothetical protein Ahy_B02g061540 isoform B [Arachis hypogaea]
MPPRPTHIQDLIWSPSNWAQSSHIQAQHLLSKRSQFPSSMSYSASLSLHVTPFSKHSATAPLDTCQHKITPRGISVSSHLYTITPLLFIQQRRGDIIKRKSIGTKKPPILESWFRRVDSVSIQESSFANNQLGTPTSNK